MADLQCIQRFHLTKIVSNVVDAIQSSDHLRTSSHNESCDVASNGP
ncbi:unnamed protein product [Rhodiola kirilowii]